MEKPGPWLWVEIGLSIFLAAMLALSYAHALPEPAYAFMAGAAFIGTAPVIWFALREALSGEWASMNMLASAALLFSLLAHEWASSAFIALMLSAARLLSILTEERTRRNIESLFALKPETAKVRRGAGLSIVPIAALSKGDEVVIEAGERVPVDGTVISGEAALDESSLTGESLPVDKAPGSKIFTGTLVASGGLTVRTDKVGKDTTLEKIIMLVESSREQRSKIYTVAETFGKTYLVLIFAFSGLLYAFTRNLDLVLSVVLVVCADDVAIAIPLAYLTAIGSSAKRGVIVKGSAHMEALGRIRTFVFDKTGTLTEGNLAVSAVIPAAGSDEKTVLAYSALASRGSAHPLSRAITAFAEKKGIPDTAPDEANVIGGKGIIAKHGSETVIIGRLALMEAEKVAVPAEVKEALERYGDQGKSVSITAVNGRAIGAIALTDEIKPEARAALAALRTLGVRRIVMLTGDNDRVAKTVAEALGLDAYHAGLLPEDKVKKIREFSAEGEVAMVGDGVNDAAALSAATVGIAMGAMGYDAAIESAQVVLMRDDLAEIPEMVRLARFVHRISMEDFWIWGATNAFGLLLVFTGVIGPAGAAAFNFISDFFPLANSVRARAGQSSYSTTVRVPHMPIAR